MIFEILHKVHEGLRKPRNLFYIKEPCNNVAPVDWQRACLTEQKLAIQNNIKVLTAPILTRPKCRFLVAVPSINVFQLLKDEEPPVGSSSGGSSLTFLAVEYWLKAMIPVKICLLFSKFCFSLDFSKFSWHLFNVYCFWISVCSLHHSACLLSWKRSGYFQI